MPSGSRSPNWLTFPLILTGLCYHSLLSAGQGWVFAIAGFAFGLVILLPFFLLGGVGAGDVKLLAGIGSWLGLHDVVAVFLVTGTLAGIYSLATMLIQGGWSGIGAALRRPARGGQTVEEVVRPDTQGRRKRLVPLATIMAVAILILMVMALV